MGKQQEWMEFPLSWFRTVSLLSHIVKIILIPNRRLRSRMEGEQFGFRKGEGTRDSIGLIRVIGEICIEKDKDVYGVFVDMEKAFDRVDGKKLMGILTKIGVDWKERRLLSNLYKKQGIKVRIGEEVSEGRVIGRGARQGCPLSPTLFNIYLDNLMKNCFLNTGGINRRKRNQVHKISR